MEISFDTLDTPALTKAQLAEMLFEQIGLNKREAKDFVDAFYEEISMGLISGHEVKIAGFGNFEVHNKSARPAGGLEAGKCLGDRRHGGHRLPPVARGDSQNLDPTGAHEGIGTGGGGKD